MSDKPNSSALLRVRDIGRRAPGSDRWLVQAVSLDVCEGERIVLVGPSGSGKSVLLRIFALLDAPDSGNLELQGKPAGHSGIPEHRRKIIYLHQRPALFEGTVEFNFETPFRLKINGDRRYDRGRVVNLLREVGRDESFLNKQVQELSGGEAQIVALIRAIQLDPVLLLLDEATAALDEETTQAAERIVARWLEQTRERALVLVSHDTEQARRVGGRMLNIKDGRLAESAERLAEGAEQ